MNKTTYPFFKSKRVEAIVFYKGEVPIFVYSPQQFFSSIFKVMNRTSYAENFKGYRYPVHLLRTCLQQPGSSIVTSYYSSAYHNFSKLTLLHRK